MACSLSILRSEVLDDVVSCVGYTRSRMPHALMRLYVCSRPMMVIRYQSLASNGGGIFRAKFVLTCVVKTTRQDI